MNEYIASNKRIAKNTLFLYARMILVLFVALYTTRVILNVLGLVDYGIYNVVAGFVTMFAFLNSAMNNTTQRFYNFVKEKEDKKNLKLIFNTAFQIQVILAVVTLIALESFGLWYIKNYMIIPPDRAIATMYVFQYATISLIILILQIPYSASIISHEKMDYYAFVSIFDAVIKLAIAIIIPYVNYDKLVFIGFTLVIVSLIDFIFYLVYSHSNFEEIRFERCFDKGLFFKMMSFSGWNMLGALAFTLQGQGLNVLINSVFGSVVNAARGVAFQIQSAINGFSENIATAFRPQLVESYAKNEFDRTESLMFSMSKYCYAMLLTLSIPIFLEIHYILDLWLKGTIPDNTIPFTYLVLTNMVVCGLNLPISQAMQATGRVRNYQIIRSVLVASTLPIAWIFLRMGYDAVSVFWVTLFISIVNQPISMIILHRYFKYSYLKYVKDVFIPCLLMTIIAPILPLFIKGFIHESFAKLLIVSISSIISSFVVIYIVILGKNEKELINNKMLSILKY